MPKDYYLILGISRASSAADIRSAFRRMVKRYHPDHQGGQVRDFIAIHEAYETLSDPVRRRQYDESLLRERVLGARTHTPEPLQKGRSRQRPQIEPLIPSKPTRSPARATTSLADMQTVGAGMEEWIENPLERYFGGRLWAAPTVYQGEITLSSEAAARGGQLSLRIPARRTCHVCRGAGGVGPYLCGSCGGSGVVDKEIPLSLDFAPGIRDGDVWSMPLEPYGIPGRVLTIHFRVV